LPIRAVEQAAARRGMSTPSLLVHTEPQCLSLRDAIATPFELVAPADAPEQPPRHASFKAYTRGCLYDSEGARIDLSVGSAASAVTRRHRSTPRCPPEQRGGTWLTGRTLYLGPFMNHYGHFITESLSRYWKQDIGPVDHVVAFRQLGTSRSRRSIAISRALENG
jgi:hypothetical protein